ncbi:MAG: pirin family protein [Prochlorococcus marinus CUG1439]|uniref:pirin family protein n=1 Tax=Prochlorococcus sp. MIT 1314 TaxID=3096220 RepID=UPI001B26F7F5|nr:pirin family protein [Prochlorococcus sp. MIT 1314]MCR8538931.1 pirin family protein [Prochlorococcus marinus CUG1439]
MSLKIIKIRKSQERFRSSREWLNSMHSFSFAEHKDPKWDNFGNIRVINEDIISPNEGFKTHSHSNMEIITVVTKGAITHRDSLNNFGKIHQDEVQVMSAGTGISHSENNEENETCKLFQIWIFPKNENIKPRYDQISLKEKLGDNLIVDYKNVQNNKLFVNQDISLWRCKYNPIKEKKLPLTIDKYNWIQIIEGDLLLKSKHPDLKVSLSSGDGLGFEAINFKDISIDTEKELDFLLFSMPSL